MSASGKGRAASLTGRVLKRRFFAYALVVALLFLFVHLLGFRRYVGVLSGTATVTGFGHYAGGLYIILYVAAVVLVPILATAGVIKEIWGRRHRSG